MGVNVGEMMDEPPQMSRRIKTANYWNTLEFILVIKSLLSISSLLQFFDNVAGFSP